MSEIKSDIQIAREAKMQPIKDILAKINVPDESSAFSPMGRHIAKINLDYLDSLKSKKEGKLILVTAITPTPAGEGKILSFSCWSSCLLYTSPSPRDQRGSRMPSSA